LDGRQTNLDKPKAVTRSLQTIVSMMERLALKTGGKILQELA
jgi:hypothetical protein